MGFAALVISAILVSSSTHAGANEQFSVVFQNFRLVELEIRWQDGSAAGVFIQVVAPMDSVTLQTYAGHGFRLVQKLPTASKTVAKFKIKGPGDTFVVEPEEGAAEAKQHPKYLQYLAGLHDAVAKKAFLDRINKLGEQGLTEVKPFRFHIPAKGSDEDAMAVVFKNFGRTDLEKFWDDGSAAGVYDGIVPAMSLGFGQVSYHGHAFKMMRRNSAGQLELVKRFVMNTANRSYVIEPDSKDLTHPKFLQHLRETAIEDEYLQKEGVHWMGRHPPAPPTLPMYAPASEIGDVAHVVQLRTEDASDRKSVELISLTAGSPHGPRSFLVRDLLTLEEAKHIVDVAEGRLRKSGVGIEGRESKTRTSKLTFVKHSETPMLARIHRRFADVLNVTDKDLSMAAEELQVVRYEQGQEYAPHFDYMNGIDRLATLLVYLDVPDDGGGTSFPRAYGGLGLKVRPTAGSAILFYSQLPDGNLDELALHGGMPVGAGVKRVCNLWLHSHGNEQWRSHRKEL